MTQVNVLVDEPVGPMRRVVLAVAGRLGWTEGQVQTVAIGVAVALVSASIGIPPVLEDRPRPDLVASPVPTLLDVPVPSTVPVVSGARPPAVAPAPLDDDGIVAPPTDADPPTTGTEPSPTGPRPSLALAGREGSCGVATRSIDNPRHPAGEPAQPVWIYEPTGTGAASVTGGRCNDRSRPVVFFAHGFGMTDPTAYIDFIEHLVSVGNIVVYPTYNVDDGERSTLEESHRVVDAGIVAAVRSRPRIDTTLVGWWGHSHGGGMVPYLVQRGGERGWGARGLWMSIVAQAYTQLVGADEIAVPARAQAMTVAFEHDAFADARLGIDVFESLVLAPSHKRHVTVLSGAAGDEPFLAEHGAPSSARDQSDAVDRLLWRYADMLELCALHGVGCAANLARFEGALHARVSDDPVDVGPYPAVLAECDAGFGPTLNPRIERCGPTRI